MRDYEQAMQAGSDAYADVLAELRANGMAASFTQTGGMNAALEVILDGGYTVLVTESDDSLPWARSEHTSWGVGLYPPGQSYDGDCIAADTAEDPSTAALVQLVRAVLVAAVNPSSR